MSFNRKISRLNAMLSTTAISTAIAIIAGSQAPAFAQTAQTAEQAPVEEIVVTGSRIVREGYEAPTPLTVVGTEQIEKAADSNLIGFLTTMPALTGSATTTSGATSLSPGTAGLQSLNLRSLGANRVLVLLDGQRTVGASYQGIVDVASFPQQLISRVDVVTGGASAVYGSDAVAGVVNFILDKKFTGVKGELSGGLTNYGDDKNYKVGLSAGFGFADDRGHILLSGEHMHNQGVNGDGGRQWNRIGFQQMSNPNYTATNGQPNQLVLTQIGLVQGTPGGLIVSGPLKGTAFGANGTPFKFNYGDLVAGSFMRGGDWQLTDIRPYDDLDPNNTSQNLFSRVSYDVTDNINVFAQYNWSQNHLRNSIAHNWVFGGATGPTIQIDNAYLPASVRTAMGTAGITNFQLGTLNFDVPFFGNDNTRQTYRFNTGLEGTLTAFDGTWHWNAYYAYGATKLSIHNPNGMSSSRYRLAIDAVVNPTTGQIVCRSTLTNPTNGCRPWNAMGTGVNAANQASFDWMNRNGDDFQHGLVKQETFAASINGEPISLWAGPVSLAVSLEHRKDSVNAVVDAGSTLMDHTIGNFAPLSGKQSVTEGALETIIPLAKGESWAEAWDFTAAARFTGYELSGFVTTYKFGTTYAPIDDIKFRVTRSRDIRAPNLFDLFSPAQLGIGTTVIDRFLPGSPQYVLVGGTLTSGNPNLAPEKADTTGVGIVLQPRFLDGFTASVDFWDVDIGGAIASINVQQTVDLCFNGQQPALCNNIIRNSAGTINNVKLNPVNLATQDVRGIDFEASYRTSASSIVSSWNGDFSLHGNMTLYLRAYQNTTLSPATDRVGENNGTNIAQLAVPNWKLTATATYALDPITASLTARAISAGVTDATYIECASGCPA